jgi:hypothetical protein
LELLKDINCESVKHNLEMEKSYRQYISLYYTEPTETHTHIVKKVKFNL